MALSNKKQVVMAKVESTYGVDAAPVASDAVLVSNLDLNPLAGDTVDRDFIRAFYGSSGTVRVSNYAELSFETELAGSGAAGTAPEWGALLKPCGFAETITAAAITGTAQVGGSTTSIKLAAAASAVDDFYTGMSVSITAGTGNGQKGEIISYVGSTKIATIAVAWAVSPDGTSTYSIGPNVMYTPVSSLTGSSATMYFYKDGLRHILLGARGTVSIDCSAKAIPKMKWKFTGLLGTITDTALVPGDFTGWQVPNTVSTANTTDLNILGQNSGVVMSNFSVDVANTVTYRQLVGSESVLLTDRKTSGSVTMETVAIAVKDFPTMVKTAATAPLCIKHGQTAGNIVGITGPKVQPTDFKFSDMDSVSMTELSLAFQPFATAGNDEIRICAK